MARAAKGSRRRSSAGVRIPVGRGFAGRIAAGRSADRHRRRRPRRRPEPDPAQEGRALAARRAAARRGRRCSACCTWDAHAARRSPTPTPRCCSSPPRGRHPRSSARGCSTRSSASIAARWRCSAACCPTACPTWSASAVAARYLPARDEVGGDWYDVIELPAADRPRHRRRRRARAAGRGAHGPAAHRHARLRAGGPRARRPARAPGSPAGSTISGGGDGHRGLRRHRARDRPLRYASAGHPPPVIIGAGRGGAGLARHRCRSAAGRPRLRLLPRGRDDARRRWTRSCSTPTASSSAGASR